MNLANLQMLESAFEHLGDIRDEVVFVGGATVELWITDDAAPEFRPTEDIDVIVEVTTRQDYYRLEERLWQAGFSNDSESGVICRFRQPESGLVLDVMPTEASILGFENRWQAEAFPHAVEVSLPGGQVISAIPPPFLLATKIEAFKTRGKLDFYGSLDFGDIVMLIDGREELRREISEAPCALRDYVSEQLRELAGHPNFDPGIEGALPSSPEARDRVDLVIWPRIRDLME